MTGPLTGEGTAEGSALCPQQAPGGRGHTGCGTGQARCPETPLSPSTSSRTSGGTRATLACHAGVTEKRPLSEEDLPRERSQSRCCGGHRGSEEGSSSGGHRPCVPRETPRHEEAPGLAGQEGESTGGSRPRLRAHCQTAQDRGQGSTHSTAALLGDTHVPPCGQRPDSADEEAKAEATEPAPAARPAATGQEAGLAPLPFLWPGTLAHGPQGQEGQSPQNPGPALGPPDGSWPSAGPDGRPASRLPAASKGQQCFRDGGWRSGSRDQGLARGSEACPPLAHTPNAFTRLFCRQDPHRPGRGDPGVWKPQGTKGRGRTQPPRANVGRERCGHLLSPHWTSLSPGAGRTRSCPIHASSISAWPYVTSGK